MEYSDTPINKITIMLNKTKDTILDSKTISYYYNAIVYVIVSYYIMLVYVMCMTILKKYNELNQQLTNQKERRI